MNELLEKIKNARKAKGLSVYKLTELSGLSPNTIYSWYNKNSRPTVEALQAVCNTLDISLAALFSKNAAETLSAQEEKLLQDFRSLSDEQRRLSMQLVSALAQKS